ncbi:MAG: S-layer homology domain-containing protein [Clostridiales Family XIII bacterium]|nr:S-layer homology domain-containing protein [Clostridiales Family XIII bacterium]
MKKREDKHLKIIVAALCLCLTLFGLAPASALAAGTAVQAGSISEAAPGATGLQIPVRIENNPGIAGAAFVFTYDTAALTLTGFTGGLFPEGGLIKNPDRNNVAFFGVTDIKENGTLFTAVFSVKSGAAAGDYEIRIGLVDGLDKNLMNWNADVVPVTFSPGKITVKAADSGTTPPATTTPESTTPDSTTPDSTTPGTTTPDVTTPGSTPSGGGATSGGSTPSATAPAATTTTPAATPSTTSGAANGLSAVNILDGNAPLAASDFTDVPKGHWAYDYVSYMAGYGFVTGKSTSLFAPSDSITRAEFITILYRMDGASAEPASVFADVPESAYYAPAVAWAVAAGVTSGVSEQSFAPGNRITRQDIATLLARYLNYKNITLDETNAEITFTDATGISGYAKDAVVSMQKADVIGGYEDGSFRPQGEATRAEAAKMLAVVHYFVSGSAS